MFTCYSLSTFLVCQYHCIRIRHRQFDTEEKTHVAHFFRHCSFFNWIIIVLLSIFSSQIYIHNHITSQRWNPRIRLFNIQFSVFFLFPNFFILQVLGPKLMENRKPFNLRYTLIIYNFIQVIFSAWLFYEVSAIQSKYSYLIFKIKMIKFSIQ